MNNITSFGITTFNSTTNTSSNNTFLYGEPYVIEINEFSEYIEIIYKETSMVQLAVYPPRPPEEKVFKIIFSCLDGKWHKSERIYGEIIPATDETYKF